MTANGFGDLIELSFGPTNWVISSIHIEDTVSLTYVPSVPSSSKYKKMRLPIIYSSDSIDFKNPKPTLDLWRCSLWDADGIVYDGEVVVSRKQGVLPREADPFEDEYDPLEEEDENKDTEDYRSHDFWVSVVKRLDALKLKIDV